MLVMNNRIACIALNMISGIGYMKYKALVEEFGEPRAIFAKSFDELISVRGVGAQLANKILNYQNDIDLESELETANRSGVEIITILDDNYPEDLRNIYDPPICLYIRGVLPKSFDGKSVAIVGSRKMSKYGEDMTKVISEGAVFHNYTVISGLAYGVDFTAHNAVVQNQGKTIAVLGGGLAKIHPQAHIPLARSIIQNGGAVISEFPLNFPVSRTSFPRRNRIVAALSKGTIVIEAGIESGAMITANLANEYGREVFAVPGHATNLQAKGCHHLIKNGQACLIECFEDVVNVLESGLGLFSNYSDEEEFSLSDSEISLNENEAKIITILQEGEKFFDELAVLSKIDSGELIGSLMSLELKFVIQKNPDKSYRIR